MKYAAKHEIKMTAATTALANPRPIYNLADGVTFPPKCDLDFLFCSIKLFYPKNNFVSNKEAAIFFTL